MKKHLIAAAMAAAVAVPAMAQVTVSGTIDSSYQSLKKNGTEEQSQSIVGSSLRSSSNLRISGAEDLGGGLKATFLLEEALNTDTGTKDSAFSRGAMVGVSGGFGTINIGKPNSTFISAMPTFNTFGGNVNQLPVTDSVTTATTLVTARPDNSIQYISPTFNGMSVNAVFSSGGEGTTAATKDHGTQTQFNLTGTVGKLSFIVGTASQDTAEAAITGATGLDFITNGTAGIGGTYIRNADNTLGTLVAGTAPTTGTNATTVLSARTAAQAARTGKVKNNGLGLTYDFGVAQVTYSFIDGKTTRTDTTGDLFKFRSQGVYAQIPMGSYSAFLSMREFKNKTASATDLDHKGHTVGVTYTLSKRTNVYALYDRVKNEAATDTATRGGTSASVGEDPSQVAIGVRHSF